MRSCWLAAAALACLAAPATAVTLDVRAGLGGVARAGRWLPVQVTVQTEDADVDGEIVVVWGEAVARRAVRLVAPARKHFELYVRDGDVTDSIEVRLDAPGQAVPPVRWPLRLAARDDLVRLCVAGGAVADASQECTATTDVSSLPHSLRGYDAADEVIWQAGAGRPLAEQQRALDGWRVVRDLEAGGVFVPLPRLPAVLPDLARAQLRTPRVVMTSGALYLIALLLLPVVVGRWRGSPLASLATAAGISAGAGVGALALGHVGPGTAVTLHHISLVQQLPEAGLSLVSTRGVAVLPAFDAVTLRLAAGDAALGRDVDGRRPEERADNDGLPILAGTFGLGARHPMSAEAIIAGGPFEVTRDYGRLRVINVSTMPLEACRIAPGSSAEIATDLGPGAAAEVALPADLQDTLVTCSTSWAPLPFTAGARAVVAHGRTTVAAYARPPVSD